MIGALITVIAWALTLAGIGTVLRAILRDRAARHARQQELGLVAARRAAERRGDERAHRERLLAQQRQIDALDALFELPTASHRGGRRAR